MNGPIRLLLAIVLFAGYPGTFMMVVQPCLLAQGVDAILTGLGFFIGGLWIGALCLYLVSSAPEFRKHRRP